MRQREQNVADRLQGVSEGRREEGSQLWLRTLVLAEDLGSVPNTRIVVQFQGIPCDLLTSEGTRHVWLYVHNLGQNTHTRKMKSKNNFF